MRFFGTLEVAYGVASCRLAMLFAASLLATSASADLTTNCSLRGTLPRLVLENLELEIPFVASQASVFTSSMMDLIEADRPSGYQQTFELIDCWTERLKAAGPIHPPQAKDFYESRVYTLREQHVVGYLWGRRSAVDEIQIEFVVVPQMIAHGRYGRSFRLTVPVKDSTQTELLREVSQPIVRSALIAGTLGWIYSTVGQMQQNPKQILDGTRCRLGDLRLAAERTRDLLANSLLRQADRNGLLLVVDEMEKHIAKLAQRPEAGGCSTGGLVDGVRRSIQ